MSTHNCMGPPCSICSPIDPQSILGRLMGNIANRPDLAKAQEDLRMMIDVKNEALRWAYEMFLARDEMNAKIHCAPLRLSPITERCKQALEL